MEFDPHTRLAGECLQPLGHLSQEAPSVDPVVAGAIAVATLDVRMSMSTIDTDLQDRIARLEHQLDLERARNAGLERGLTALDHRVTELREENALLREALDARDDDAPRFTRTPAVV